LRIIVCFKFKSGYAKSHWNDDTIYLDEGKTIVSSVRDIKIHTPKNISGMKKEYYDRSSLNFGSLLYKKKKRDGEGKKDSS